MRMRSCGSFRRKGARRGNSALFPIAGRSSAPPGILTTRSPFRSGAAVSIVCQAPAAVRPSFSRSIRQKEVDFHNPVVLPRRPGVGRHASSCGPSGRFVSEVIGSGGRGPALGDSIVPVAHLASGHLLVERIDANVGLWAVPYSGSFPLKIEDGFLVAPAAVTPSAANDGSLLSSLPATAFARARARLGRSTGQDRCAVRIAARGFVSALVVARSTTSRVSCPRGRRRARERVQLRRQSRGLGTRPRHQSGYARHLRRDEPAAAVVVSGWTQADLPRRIRRSTRNELLPESANGSGEPVELLKGMNPEVSPGRAISALHRARAKCTTASHRANVCRGSPGHRRGLREADAGARDRRCAVLSRRQFACVLNSSQEELRRFS